MFLMTRAMLHPIFHVDLHEVWQDGEHVHEVESVGEEGFLVRGAQQPQHVLQAEPDDADHLVQGEQRVVLHLPVIADHLEQEQNMDKERDQEQEREQ